MAFDAASSGRTKADMSIYKPLVGESAGFLDDVLNRLYGPGCFKHVFESTLAVARESAYDIPEEERKAHNYRFTFGRPSSSGTQDQNTQSI
jgi:hypothetical protein